MKKENEFFAKLQERLQDIADQNGLNEEKVEITCSVLTTDEAIGKPDRNDFPLQKGKEKLMQARCGASYGQAFTDMPHDYSGKVGDLAAMPLNTNFERAVFISGLNAVLRDLKMTDHTIHCRDDGPRQCSLDIAATIEKEYGQPRIAMFGLQPAIAEVLSQRFELRIFDLDPDNIGHPKFGKMIESGECEMDQVEAWADLFLVTGSTICNGSIVDFLPLKKPVIFFGTTIAGTASLLGLKRLCPQST
ncbi:MAG: DUF364 domain-containing protein [Syntrophomonadaceae bacterium]